MKEMLLKQHSGIKKTSRECLLKMLAIMQGGELASMAMGLVAQW